MIHGKFYHPSISTRLSISEYLLCWIISKVEVIRKTFNVSLIFETEREREREKEREREITNNYLAKNVSHTTYVCQPSTRLVLGVIQIVPCITLFI